MSDIKSLGANDVHIWRLNLNWNEPSYGSILSDDEHRKISRFINSKHQQFAFSMRVQLRILLSTYLQVSPESMVFTRGEYGKPKLVNSTLFFNVTHSQDSAAVCISHLNYSGVDIEYWRDVSNREKLVERHYSNDERALWAELEENKKQATFFKRWTCKEAFIKATGRGLGMGLKNCSFRVYDEPQLLACLPEYGLATEWTCRTLSWGKAISATLVVKANNCNVKQFDFGPKCLPAGDGSL